MKSDKMAPLKTAAGAEFDKVFATAMLEDHTKDVDEAKAARSATAAAKLKALLDSTIPVLEKHRETAQKLVASIAPSSAPTGKVPVPAK